MKRLELPRDEIAFRKEYSKLVESKSLTTVFRPGNRIFPNWRGYKPGEKLTARIISIVGDDSTFTPPVFTDFKECVIVKEIKLVSLSNLSDIDFIGSSDDIKNRSELISHLKQIYGKEPGEYDELVTKIVLSYGCES